jgi:hypothetical protein
VATLNLTSMCVVAAVAGSTKTSDPSANAVPFAGIVPPVCRCPPVYVPVCVGGQTYENRCQAYCYGASGPVCAGECGPDCEPAEPLPAKSPCVCSQEFKLQCYAGLLYANPCLAKCAGASDADLSPPGLFGDCIASYLQAQARYPLPCGCTVMDRRMYGYRCYNGKLYPSPCEARCAGGTDSTIKLLGPSSECISSTLDPVPAAAKPGCPRVCTLEYSPRCYKGTTYGNACEAKCAGATDATMTGGPCADTPKPPVKPAKPVKPTCESTCGKTDHLRQGSTATPVCDNKGKRYSNACMARCAKVPQSQIRPCPAPKSAKAPSRVGKALYTPA